MSSKRGQEPAPPTPSKAICAEIRESRRKDFLVRPVYSQGTVHHDVLSIPLCYLGSYSPWEAGWITFSERVIILIDFPARKFYLQPTFSFLHFLVKSPWIILCGLEKKADILNGFPLEIDLNLNLASFWLFLCSKLLACFFYVKCFLLSWGLECCSLGNKFH